MPSVDFNPNSMTTIQFGTFRDIVKESETSRTGQAMRADARPVAAEMFDVPSPGSGDALRPDRIAVDRSGRPPVRNDAQMNQIAKNLGFKDADDFSSQLGTMFAERCKTHGIAVPGAEIPSKSIARTLLSTDVALSFREKPQLVAGQNPKETFLQTGLAMMALVNDKRLSLADAFFYANRKADSIDTRNAADMAEAAQTILAGARQKLADCGGILARAEAFLHSVEGKAPSAREAATCQHLRQAVDAYREAVAKLFPDELLGAGEAEFGSPREYLEAQQHKLEKFLSSTYSPKPSAADLLTAANYLSAALRSAAGEKRALPIAPEVREEITNFIDKDGLRNQMSVLHAQMRLSLRSESESLIRHEQEIKLRSLGLDPSKPPREGSYSFTIGGGIMAEVGIPELKGKFGPKADLKVELTVDRNGKATITKVATLTGEISLSAKLGIFSGDFSVGLKGSRGKGLVYENLADLLQNSPGDLLARLNGGLKGMFHSKIRTDYLARRVDNTTFRAMMTDYGVLSRTGNFLTPAVNRKVVSEQSIRKTAVEVGMGLEFDAGVVDVKGEAKVEAGVSKVDSTEYTPGYQQLATKETLSAASGGVFLVGGDGKRVTADGCFKLADGAKQSPDAARQFIRSNLEMLNAALSDFEQAARYESWSGRHLKFVHRRREYMAPPRVRLTQQLEAFLPGQKITKKNMSAAMVKYLQMCQVSLAALTYVGKQLDDDDGLLGQIEALQGRVLSPDCKIDSELAKTMLYTSKTSSEGRTVSVHAEVQVDVSGIPTINAGGVNVFQGLNPGVKAEVEYSCKMGADRIGLPDEDAEELEVAVTGNNIPFEQVAFAVARNVLRSSAPEELVGDGAVAALQDGIRDASPLSLVPEISLGSAVHIGIESENSVGAGVKFKFVRSPEGKWVMGGRQLVMSSESSLGVSLGGMPNLVGGEGSVKLETSKSVVLKEAVTGKSLVPMLKAAKDFNVSGETAGDIRWRAFQAENLEGMKELMDNLLQPDSIPAKELAKYREAASKLQEQPTPPLHEAIDSALDRLKNAHEVQDRLGIMADLFGVLSEVAEGVAKEKPYGKLPPDPQRDAQAKSIVAAASTPVTVSSPAAGQPGGSAANGTQKPGTPMGRGLLGGASAGVFFA